MSREPAQPAVDPYPRKPGREPCSTYAKTGRCAFIDNYAPCNFDHPPSNASQAAGFIPASKLSPVPVYAPSPARRSREEVLATTGKRPSGNSVKQGMGSPPAHPAGEPLRASPLTLLRSVYPRNPGKPPCLKQQRTGHCPKLDNGAKCPFDHPPTELDDARQAAPALSPGLRMAMSAEIMERKPVEVPWWGRLGCEWLVG
jgi:hypothetical protein